MRCSALRVSCRGRRRCPATRHTSARHRNAAGRSASVGPSRGRMYATARLLRHLPGQACASAARGATASAMMARLHATAGSTATIPPRPPRQGRSPTRRAICFAVRCAEQLEGFCRSDASITCRLASQARPGEHRAASADTILMMHHLAASHQVLPPAPAVTLASGPPATDARRLQLRCSQHSYTGVCSQQLEPPSPPPVV